MTCTWFKLLLTYVSLILELYDEEHWRASYYGREGLNSTVCNVYVYQYDTGYNKRMYSSPINPGR